MRRGRVSRVAGLVGAAALLAGGLSVLGSHSAFALYSNACSSSNFGNPIVYTNGTGPAHVYAGGGGRTGAATEAAGVCIDDTPLAVTPPSQVYNGSGAVGGDIEAGANPSNGELNGPFSPVSGVPGAYAIVDGSDNNGSIPDPTGQTYGPDLGGYIGITDFETGNYGPGANDFYPNACGMGTGANGSDAGGAVMAKPLCVSWSSIVGGLGLTPGWKYGLPLPVACGSWTSSDDWDNTPRDGCFFP